MNEISCPFCDIYSINTVINEDGYTGKKCNKCDTIYISPRPDECEIIELYKKDDSHISAESHISRDFVQRLYARHNLSLIKRFVKSGSILEIGAGAGYFLDEAKNAGFDVCGIELNGKQAQFITDKLGIDCETDPLSENSFKGRNFDLIYHCDVMSHFRDPIATFNIINSKLNEGGFIIFETGNLGDVDYKYFKYIPSFQYPDHLFFFSNKSIRILLERTGFELIKKYNYSILPQLLLRKKIMSIVTTAKGVSKRKILEEGNISHNASNKKTQKRNTKTILKRFVKNVYWYLFYHIRYNVGSIYFMKGRPQTIIIIAQKA